MSRPRGGAAVMARRREPPDSLEFFPTPPWATRALLEHVIPAAGGTCWEPAAGEGHMADVLAERFRHVYRTDVHDYGGLDAVGSFIGVGPDVLPTPELGFPWIITNPPFSRAVEFFERCLIDSSRGFALLLRTSWMEGGERFKAVFHPHPPTAVWQFAERVPMTKGRWDPDADTATAYAWFVWMREAPNGRWMSDTRLRWIPPGCRRDLDRPQDYKRFSGSTPTPLTA